MQTVHCRSVNTTDDPGFQQGDPARIPWVLEEVRATWEGQPDLTLATLFGVLAQRGIAWGSSDEELVSALAEERADHPPQIARGDDGRATVPVVVDTIAPEHRITVNGSNVVVRSAGDRDRQPSVWTYASLRPAGPGQPLVVTDLEGVDHRLGVVTLISTFDVGGSPALNGLQREDIGNAVWIVELQGGNRAIVTHRIHVWTVEGRSAQKTTHAWIQVVRCVVGEDFVFAPAGGGDAVCLGRVNRVVLAEA